MDHVQWQDAGKLEYHIPERFDRTRPAFTASHVDYGASMPEHPLASQLPSGAPGDEPAVVGDPFHLRPLMRPDDGPKEIGDYLYSDRPQLSVHIVSFTDATLVSLTWPHTLWDAMGRREFLLAWTAILAGRIDNVTPAYGPDEYPLQDFYDNPDEPYKLLNKRLSLPQLLLFGFRYWFDSFWYSEEKGRVVCLPAAFMDSLRATAMEEARAAAGTSAQDVFLSDGDLITAWCSRMFAQHAQLSPGQTICILNALGWRTLLQPDVLSPSKAYIGNAASGAFAHVKAEDVVSRPLSYTALEVRGAIKEQATRSQLEAFAHLSRETLKTTGAPLLLGDATMQLIIVSNWSKAKFFDMDFSGALGGHSKPTGDSTSPVKPVYIQACAFNKGSPVRNAFQVSGKDAQGNYWLSATLRGEVWDAIEQALRGTAGE